ncbi:hypothetical protein MRB53_039159 [Persea americana]|nr:hypothetical protein MRB53_039159 [Persea americana]
MKSFFFFVSFCAAARQVPATPAVTIAPLEENVLIDSDLKFFQPTILVEKGKLYEERGWHKDAQGITYSTYYPHDKTGHKKKYFPDSWQSVILWLDGLGLFAYGVSVSVNSDGPNIKWEQHIFPTMVSIVDMRDDNFVLAKSYNTLRASPVLNPKFLKFKPNLVDWANMSKEQQKALDTHDWGKDHASQDCPFKNDKVFKQNIEAAFFNF